MGPIIKLRKFDHMTVSRLVLTLALVFPWLATAETNPSLPLIRTVGVIPVQARSIDGKQDLNASRKTVGENFGDAVRASKRFIVLDDDFVKSMWESPDSRAELSEEHELHGFVSLEIQLRDDTILLYTRLLSPQLETYLIESESMSRSEFALANKDKLKTALQELVFRTFNRLPIDSTITSIQGKYVTLSGGQEQGINNKDEFTIEHASIATTHPATGAWLKFDRKVLGKVKVVEVKPNSAIAEITQMTADDSMNIGDGAKISDLASRLRFKRMKPETPTAATDAKPVPSTPFYDPGTPADLEPKAGKSIDPVNVPSEKAPVASEDKPGDDSGSGPSDLLSTVHKFVDYGDVALGFKFWSTSGTVSGKASSFPLNMIQADGGHFLSPNLAIDGSFHVGAGSTKKGSFTNFGAGARLIYLQPLQDQLSWYVGGGGGLTSLAVSGELLGGFDFIYGGGVAGMTGVIPYEQQAFRWNVEAELRPFNIGAVGARSAKKDVDSSLANSIRLRIFQEASTKKTLEWGAIMESNSGTYSLSTGDFKYSDVTMLGAAQIRF